jgi:hypothetical protein
VPLPAAFVTAERFGDRGPTMVVSPHLSHLTLGEGVAGDNSAGPANLEAGAVDGPADLDELAQHLRSHRMADAIDADERHDVVDPTSLDVVGVETDPRQRRQKLQLDLCSLGRRHTGGSRRHGMHPLVEPHPDHPTRIHMIPERDFQRSLTEQLAERFGDAATHLADAATDVLALTGFPKVQLAPDLVQQPPGTAQQGAPPPHRHQLTEAM